MSDKYRNAMDRIVMSDELREKIMKNTMEAASKKESDDIWKIDAVTIPSKRFRNFFGAKQIMAYAACLLICAAAVTNAGKYLKQDNTDGVISTETTQTAEPSNSAETTQTAELSNSEGAAQTADNSEMQPQGNIGESTVVSDNNKKITESESKSRSSILSNSGKRTDALLENKEDISVKGNNENNSLITNPSINKNDDKNNISESVPNITDSENTNSNKPNESNVPDNVNDDLLQQGPVLSANPNAGAGSSGGGENDEQCGAVSPWMDFDTIDDLRKNAGFIFKLPQYMPDGYKEDSASLMFGRLVDIRYKSTDDEIVYRTEKTEDDISGDYNQYEKTEKKTIGKSEVTIKKNKDSCHNAVWSDGESYSVSSAKGISEEEMTKIIESVDYPKDDDTGENLKQSSAEQLGENKADEVSDDKKKADNKTKDETEPKSADASNIKEESINDKAEVKTEKSKVTDEETGEAEIIETKEMQTE